MWEYWPASRITPFWFDYLLWELTSDVKDCPRRRFAILRLTISNKIFYFFALERFKNNRFRTGILNYGSGQSLISALPRIESELIDKKGVWKNTNASDCLRGTVSHGTDPTVTAKQILKKIGLNAKSQKIVTKNQQD